MLQRFINLNICQTCPSKSDGNTSLVRLHIKLRQFNSRQQTDAELANIFRHTGWHDWGQQVLLPQTLQGQKIISWQLPTKFMDIPHQHDRHFLKDDDFFFLEIFGKTSDKSSGLDRIRAPPTDGDDTNS